MRVYKVCLSTVFALDRGGAAGAASALDLAHKLARLCFGWWRGGEVARWGAACVWGWSSHTGCRGMGVEHACQGAWQQCLKGSAAMLRG